MKRIVIEFPLYAAAILIAAASLHSCEILSPDPDSDGSGSVPERDFSCNEAKENAGAKKVWVGGFISGGDLSASKISFTPPFHSDTNIALSDSLYAFVKDSCISVQLPKGAIRDSLNLVRNPEKLWRYVLIKGDIVESYFGITGIKNASDYYFPDDGN